MDTGIQIVKDVLVAVVFLIQESAVVNIDRAVRLIGFALAQLYDAGSHLLVDAILGLLDALPE